MVEGIFVVADKALVAVVTVVLVKMPVGSGGFETRD